MRRIAFLDGLRGICALQVVLFHCAVGFGFSWGTPLLDNSGVPVCVFFLISGYVLTSSFRAGRLHPVKLGMARLVRLMIPSIVSAAIALAVILMFHEQVNELGTRLHSLFLTQHVLVPTRAEAIQELDGFDILFGYSNFAPFIIPGMINVDHALNSPLWTISYEVLGSIWILCLVLSERFDALYGALLGASVLLFGSNPLCLFVAGHLAARYDLAGAPSSLRRTAIGIMLLCAYLAMLLLHRLPGEVSFLLNHGLAIQFGAGGVVNDIAALLLFFGVLILPVCRVLLCWPVFQWLGRISFSLYLVHMSVMISVGVAAYHAGMGHGALAAASLMVVATVSVSFCAALIFERLVDRPSIWLSRAIKRVWKFIPVPASAD